LGGCQKRREVWERSFESQPWNSPSGIAASRDAVEIMTGLVGTRSTFLFAEESRRTNCEWEFWEPEWQKQDKPVPSRSRAKRSGLMRDRTLGLALFEDERG
jgi:hypothetical protein